VIKLKIPSFQILNKIVKLQQIILSKKHGNNEGFRKHKYVLEIKNQFLRIITVLKLITKRINSKLEVKEYNKKFFQK